MRDWLKRWWWVFPAGGITLALLVGAAFALFGSRPGQHDAKRYGALTIRWDPADWPTRDRERLQAAMVEASRLGPRVMLVEGPGDVTLVRGDWECSGARARAGVYRPARREIAVDPVCTRGDTAFQATVVHEVGHALGMQHIRRTGTEDCGDCVERAEGNAVMNPSLEYQNPLADPSDTLTPETLVTGQVTELDLAEFRRAWTQRQH